MDVLDLHVHTVRMSPDSELNLDDLKRSAEELGLHGAGITEHDRMWDAIDTSVQREKYGFNFLRGMEVSTDMGHVLVYGLDAYVSGLHQAVSLRHVVNAAGGVMISAHPFRRIFRNDHLGGYRLPKSGHGFTSYGDAIEQLARWPILGLVDAIEVINGGTDEMENFLAYEVAQYLGKTMTAGSDAHSVHGLGQFVTIFQTPVRNVEGLIEEVKAGRTAPGTVITTGTETELIPFGRDVVRDDLEERIRAAIGVTL